MKKMKIAIIGGGLTGLTAAYRLSKQGHKVTLIERENNLGGLVQSFEIEDKPLEKFYHHIFKTDSYIVNLLTELGLYKRMLWLESRMAIYRDGSVFPFSTPIDLIKFKPLSFFARIRAGVITLFLQKYKNWEIFKNISAYSWMRKYAGKEVTDVIWEPLLIGKFGKYYKDISMAWLWARIHIRANSREGVGEKEMLGYMKGGYKILVDKIESEIVKMNGRLFLESSVKNIRRDKSMKVELEINGNKELFDKVVITIPSSEIRYLFSKEESSNKNLAKYFSRLESIKYLAAMCLVFSSDQNLSEYYWHNINDTEFPFLVFVHHTKFVNKDMYSGKYIYYIGKYLAKDDPVYSLEKEEIEKQWFSALKKIFPKFDLKKVSETFLFHSNDAQHIVDQKYFSNVSTLKMPIPSVYVSNFSLIYPEDRGMNYAVREGEKIAEIIFK